MSDNFDTMFDGDSKKVQQEGNMLEFARFCFTKVYILLLCLMVVGFVVGGVVVGVSFDKMTREPSGYAFLGGLIGLIIGILIALWKNGETIVLLSIGENIQKIAQKMDAISNTGTPQETMVAQEQLQTPVPAAPPPAPQTAPQAEISAVAPPSDPLSEISADERLTALLKEVPVEKLQALIDIKSVRT